MLFDRNIEGLHLLGFALYFIRDGWRFNYFTLKLVGFLLKSLISRILFASESGWDEYRLITEFYIIWAFLQLSSYAYYLGMQWSNVLWIIDYSRAKLAIDWEAWKGCCNYLVILLFWKLVYLNISLYGIRKRRKL